MARDIARFSPTLESRYWAHIDARGADECWPWTVSTNHQGYGRILVGYDADGIAILHYAHRVGWKLAHGEDPGAQEIRHTCDNPPCQNPAHFELGSHADNMRDMAERGRARYVRGEAAGGAKLTETAVLDIVSMRAQGHTLKSIACQHGVHFATVQSILTGRTWADVTGLPRVRRLARVPFQGNFSGASNNYAKLSEADVRAIKAAAAAGSTQAKIAEQFSISQTTVSRILSGKRWGSSI